VTRRKKSKAGRPSLGDHGRSKVVSIKLSEIEYRAIAARAGSTPVSSWIRSRTFDVTRIEVERDEDAWHWIAYDGDGHSASVGGIDHPRDGLEIAVCRAAETHGLVIADDCRVEVAD
jgi:hypothetical protein